MTALDESESALPNPVDSIERIAGTHDWSFDRRTPAFGRMPCRVLSAAMVLILLGGISDAGAQSLEETLVTAYQSIPRLQAARAGVRATDERVSQALSGWRPTVEVSAEGGTSHVDSTSTTPRNQGRTPWETALTVTQNLYKGGRTAAETRRVDNEVKADRARLLAEEQAVLLAAATVYADIVRDQAVFELNTRNETVLQTQRDATQKRFRGGEVTKTDVSQARSRRLRATAARVQAAGDLANSRARYRNVTGAWPRTLSPAEPLDDLRGSPDEAVSLARKNAPEVLAARFDERAALDQIRLVWGELLPVVGLEGEISRVSAASSRNSRTDTAKISLTFTMPLYQSGSVSARIREAKEVAAQRRKQLVQVERDAMEEAARAGKDLQTARGRIVALTAAVKVTRSALQGVRREVLVGTRTILDTLDAEQELLDAEVNLVRAQRDEVVSSFALRKAVGWLTAERLGLPVKLYDPAIHYRATRDRWFGTGLSEK